MNPLPDTTSADVRDRKPSIAVLPIGSYEQHGAFMPLATDTIVASAIADVLGRLYNVLVLPPITISCSHEHSAWPGTVSITHQTLSAIIADVAASLAGQGIRHLALVNAHGGNYVLSNIVQAANATQAGSMTLFPTSADWNRARRDAGLETTAHEDMHAGELETSILAEVWPESLREGATTGDHLADDRPLLLLLGMSAYTASGVIGRPSLGTSAKGKVLLSSLADSFAAHIEALGVQWN